MSHNIDFHAVTGPGGGAASLNTEPGEESKLRFKALNAGLYFCHCATAGMYGGILVEPVSGLPRSRKRVLCRAERVLHLAGKKGDTLEFSFENGLAEHPSHVVFNGSAGSLVKNPLTAKVGDTIRMFYINAGPNLTANWHVIDEIFDRVYPEGSLVTPPFAEPPNHGRACWWLVHGRV